MNSLPKLLGLNSNTAEETEKIKTALSAYSKSEFTESVKEKLQKSGKML